MSRKMTLSLQNEREMLKRDGAASWLEMTEWQTRKRPKRPWSGPSAQWLIDVLTEILNEQSGATK